MALRLFNTLHHKKEDFVPIEEGKVKCYSCGPTVYNYAHLGNLRSYMLMDTLHRILVYIGYDVTLVMNITDVGHLTDDADQGEDKMEKGARREGKTVWDVAQFYTEQFMKDLESLNILHPTIVCKATDHIAEQIEMIKKIEENGYTYTTEDGVYFDTSKLSDYGKMIDGFDPSALQAGKRVDLGGKKNATDFALWKFSPSDEQRAMEWPSPWAEKGFPGWHIECTAMGCKYLGSKFDLHTGGIDHIPVHHTNEIAQAQATCGHDHVNYWLHNEFLVLKGNEKMAKSSGNFLRLQTILEKGFSALDYRYFCLLTHYRKPLMFSWDALEAAKVARTRLTDRVIALKESTAPGSSFSELCQSFQSRFMQMISDDLNTAEAVGLLHEMLKSDLKDEEKLSLVLDWDGVFGLNLKHAHKDEVEIPSEIQALVDERESLRAKKDFAGADKMRDQLSELGWSVSDGPNGPVVELSK